MEQSSVFLETPMSLQEFRHHGRIVDASLQFETADSLSRGNLAETAGENPVDKLERLPRTRASLDASFLK